MRTAAQIDADLEAWAQVQDLVAEVDASIPEGDPLAGEVRRANDLVATLVGHSKARALRDRPAVEQLDLEAVSS